MRLKTYLSSLLFALSLFPCCIWAQTTWQKVDVGLEGDNIDLLHIDNKGVLYVAANDVLWQSKDQGATWVKVNAHPPTICFLDSDAAGNLYIGYAGIYKSSDEGKSWTLISPPILETPTSVLHLKDMIVDDDGAIWTKHWATISQDGSYQYHLSKDNGKSYSKIAEATFFLHTANVKGYTYRVNNIVYDGATASSMKDIYRTTDGSNWKLVLTVPETFSSYLFSKQGYLMVLSGNQVYRSVDQGETWEKTSPAPLATCGSTCSASLSEDGFGKAWLWVGALSRNFISVDGGKTWNVSTSSDWRTSYVDALGNQYRIDNNIHRQKDGIQTTIFSKKGYLLVTMGGIKAKDGVLYDSYIDRATYEPKVLQFDSQHLAWTPLTTVQRDEKLNTYSTQNGLIRLESDKRIVRVNENGQVLTTLISTLQGKDVMLSVDASGEIIVAHYSANNVTRYQLNKDKSVSVLSVLSRPANAPANVGVNEKVYYAENGGWLGASYSTQLTPSSPFQQHFLLNQGAGKPWVELDLKDIENASLRSPSLNFDVLPSKQLLLYSVLKDDAFISNADYSHWQSIFPSNYQIINQTFVIDSQKHFWVLANRKADLQYDLSNYKDAEPYLIHSTDEGKTWEEVSSPTNGYRMTGLIYDNARYVYVLSNQGIYRTDTISSLAVNGEISSTAILNAAYPNPFSQSTTFGVSLPKASRVSIGIYNMLGQRIHTLSDVDLPAGTYSFDWQAANVPSGVYLARIQADGKVQSQKLTVVH